MRRLFSAPKPRIITLLSSLPDADKDMLLVNLGAAVARTGSEILLVDARPDFNGIAARIGKAADLSLAQAVHGRIPLEEAICRTPQGCALLMLRKGGDLHPVSPDLLVEAFETVTRNARIVLVDGDIAEDNSLALPAMEYGEVVLQLSTSQEAIKSAYTLLKRLNVRLGRRPFGILVTGSSEREALTVSNNLVEAANRYLAVSLNFLGWVPADGHLEHAARLGKPVVDAFPRTGAAAAFRQIAENIVSV